MILEFETINLLTWSDVPSFSTYLSVINPYEYSIYLTFILLLVFLISLYITYKNNDSWKPYERSVALTNFLNLIFLLSSVFWAAAVSVFGTKLHDQWTGICDIGYESLLFVTSASIAIYLGVRSFLSAAKKEENDKINPSSDVVKIASERIIAVQDNYERCHEDWVLTYSNFEDIEEEQLEVLEKTIVNSITNCMDNMLEVLHTWTSDRGTVIKVNLLNILDSKSVLKELQKKPTGGLVNTSILEKSPFFLFNDNWQSCLQRCDKVLINEQTLTQVIGTCDVPRAHSPLCMPYSINDTNDAGAQMQPNLIGAPEALKTGSIKYITPLQNRIEDFIISKIKGSCYSEHATRKFEIGLRKYYDTDTAASIISIPLSYIGPKVLYDNEDLCIELNDYNQDNERFSSVLNIYAHSNYILANNDVVQSYCQLTKPILDTLAKLVSMRLQLLSDVEAKKNQKEQRHLERFSGILRSKVAKILPIGGQNG
ncbi:hypothetical protein I3262_06795 [Photobacterium damselae]|nr:hypothetical protein [Photobacterium damselae]